MYGFDDFKKDVVIKCLRRKSTGGKSVIFFDTWVMCAHPRMFNFACTTLCERALQFDDGIDAIGLVENTGQVFGSILFNCLKKPLVLVTEKEDPGFRPENFDFKRNGGMRILLADAAIETGIHIERAIRRIRNRGGIPTVLIVLIDNDLVPMERIIDIENRISINSVLKLSTISNEIMENL